MRPASPLAWNQSISWGWDPRTGSEELELSAAGSLVVLELQPLVQIKESFMVLSHSSVIEAELFAISVCRSGGVNAGSGGREQTGPPGLLTLSFFFLLATFLANQVQLSLNQIINLSQVLKV